MDPTRCSRPGFFEAVRRSINGELEGCSIVDLLRGEWNEINLSEKECKKIAAEYKKIAKQCIGELQTRVSKENIW